MFITFGIKGENLGTVYIELYQDVVPKTVENFVKLILSKYKNCKMHRIIPGFVIQGGDFTRGDGTGGNSIWGGIFEDENFKLKHDDIGILSMANAGPDTNGSQFFITLDYQPSLNNKHVVFGKVYEGLDVLRRVEKFGTASGTTTQTVKIIDCGLVK